MYPQGRRRPHHREGGQPASGGEPHPERSHTRRGARRFGSIVPPARRVLLELRSTERRGISMRCQWAPTKNYSERAGLAWLGAFCRQLRPKYVGILLQCGSLEMSWECLARQVSSLNHATIRVCLIGGSRTRRNGIHEVAFKHFLVVAPEDDKMGSQGSDSIFWPWFQRSTKYDPGAPI